MFNPHSKKDSSPVSYQPVKMNSNEAPYIIEYATKVSCPDVSLFLSTLSVVAHNSSFNSFPTAHPFLFRYWTSHLTHCKSTNSRRKGQKRCSKIWHLVLKPSSAKPLVQAGVQNFHSESSRWDHKCNGWDRQYELWHC